MPKIYAIRETLQDIFLTENSSELLDVKDPNYNKITNHLITTLSSTFSIQNDVHEVIESKFEEEKEEECLKESSNSDVDLDEKVVEGIKTLQQTNYCIQNEQIMVQHNRQQGKVISSHTMGCKITPKLYASLGIEITPSKRSTNWKHLKIHMYMWWDATFPFLKKESSYSTRLMIQHLSPFSCSTKAPPTESSNTQNYFSDCRDNGMMRRSFNPPGYPRELQNGYSTRENSRSGEGAQSSGNSENHFLKGYESIIIDHINDATNREVDLFQQIFMGSSESMEMTVKKPPDKELSTYKFTAYIRNDSLLTTLSTSGSSHKSVDETPSYPFPPTPPQCLDDHHSHYPTQQANILNSDSHFRNKNENTTNETNNDDLIDDITSVLEVINNLISEEDSATCINLDHDQTDITVSPLHPEIEEKNTDFNCAALLNNAIDPRQIYKRVEHQPTRNGEQCTTSPMKTDDAQRDRDISTVEPAKIDEKLEMIQNVDAKIQNKDEREDFLPIKEILEQFNSNSPSVVEDKGLKENWGCSERMNEVWRRRRENSIDEFPQIQVRVQNLLTQLGLPPNTKVEIINGDHGIKNPLHVNASRKKRKRVHSNLNRKTCEDESQSMLCDNQKINSNPSYICSECGKVFKLQRLLERHIRCHTMHKRFLCTFCGKGFNDRFDLKRHARTHTGIRPYSCETCGKRFTQRCSLESHYQKVHQVSHEYQFNERRFKIYVCEECGNSTKSSELHFAHVAEKHPNNFTLLSKFNDKRHFKFKNSLNSS